MKLDLILENIRLGHIEALLQEATTDLEVVQGQRIINESIMQLRGVLMEEADRPNGILSKVKPIPLNSRHSPLVVASYQKTFVNPSINARNNLAGEIRGLRQKRDLFNSTGKSGSGFDNQARFKSAYDGQNLIDEIKRQPIDNQPRLAEKIGNTPKIVKSYNPTNSSLATTRLARGLDDKVTPNTIGNSLNPLFHIAVQQAQQAQH